MKPEPTPSDGTVPNGSVVVPSVVIFTTAGPTLAAASMTAEDSLMVTGWVPVVWPLPMPDVCAGRLKTPCWPSTATVPPEARTADRADATITVPTPAPRRWRDGLRSIGAAGRGTAAGSPYAAP